MHHVVQEFQIHVQRIFASAGALDLKDYGFAFFANAGLLRAPYSFQPTASRRHRTSGREFGHRRLNAIASLVRWR
jgi:hypothetical protein